MPIIKEDGGPQGQSEWVQNILPPTGMCSQDHPACSKLLYQLCCPSPLIFVIGLKIESCTAEVTQV